MPRAHALRTARASSDLARAERVSTLAADPKALARRAEELFQTLTDAELAAMVKTNVDLQLAARREIANRGLDTNAQWVGFPAAAKLHKVG
jgi:hypothetical protein